MLLFLLLVLITSGTYNSRSFLPSLNSIMPIIYPLPHQTQKDPFHQDLQFPPLECSKCQCLQTEQSFVSLPIRSLTSRKTRYLALHHVQLLLLRRPIHQARSSPPVGLNVRQVPSQAPIRNAQLESVFIARISSLLMFLA